jgi:hypothetical protein
MSLASFPHSRSNTSCAQVDIDFALAGIDKLLRSQELTFAFVGVAPSLVVLYIAGGWLRSLVFNGDRRKKGRFGGKRGREMSFQTMRYGVSPFTKRATSDSLSLTRKGVSNDS